MDKFFKKYIQFYYYNPDYDEERFEDLEEVKIKGYTIWHFSPAIGWKSDRKVMPQDELEQWAKYLQDLEVIADKEPNFKPKFPSNEKPYWPEDAMNQEKQGKIWLSKINKLKEEYKESKNNITLYHGTDSRHIDKIKEHGIVASQYESPKWFMLSSNKSGAIFHATKDDNIEPYLLTIEIPNDKISEYLWKPREENTFKWYALKKAIPKEFIKKSEVIDSDTWDKTKAKGFNESFDYAEMICPKCKWQDDVDSFCKSENINNREYVCPECKHKWKKCNKSAITEEPNVPQAAPTPPPGPQGLNQPANPEKANQKRKQMGQKANNWLKNFGRVMPNVSRELQTGNMGQNSSNFFTLLAQMPKQDWYKYYFRQ